MDSNDHLRMMAHRRMDKEFLKEQEEDQKRWNAEHLRRTKGQNAVRLAEAYLDLPCTDDRGCTFDGEHYTPLDVAYELSMAVRTHALEAVKTNLDEIKKLVQEAIDCAKDDKASATLEMLVKI